MGMALLGQIIAIKQNKSYADVLQANILNPLGMSSTYLQKVGVVKQLVQGIDATGNSVSAWDFKAIEPAGGLKSNVLDMKKFARHQLNHNSLTHQKQFNINPQMDMALGWHILKIKGKSYIWHNGGTGGFTSALVLDKIAQKAVVILSNTSPGVFAEKHTNLDKIALSLIQSF
jgi:CubicO group peptidase (beta-lactamase class C family)